MAFKTKRTGLSRETGYTYEGKQIVLHKEGGKPLKTARNDKNWWPDKKKIEVATLYAVLRDEEKVSQLAGVHSKIILQWLNEPWFGEILLKVRKDRNEKLDLAITDVLEKGLEIVLDRFENGEMMVNRKTGETYRVPVNVKNVALVADVFFDKRQLIRGEATTRTEVITQEEKLEKLRENFEKLARSKLINPTVEALEGEAHELPEATSQAEAQEARDGSGTNETPNNPSDGSVNANHQMQGSGNSLNAIQPELPPELQAGSSDGVSGTEAPTSTQEPSPQDTDGRGTGA